MKIIIEGPEDAAVLLASAIATLFRKHTQFGDRIICNEHLPPFNPLVKMARPHIEIVLSGRG